MIRFRCTSTTTTGQQGQRWWRKWQGWTWAWWVSSKLNVRYVFFWYVLFFFFSFSFIYIYSTMTIIARTVHSPTYSGGFQRIPPDSSGLQQTPAESSPGLCWCDMGQLCMSSSPESAGVHGVWQNPPDSTRVRLDWVQQNPPDSMDSSRP